MQESPKLNEVAVDNSPEPKPEKDGKGGCARPLFFGACPIAVMATRNFAEYFEWKIPRFPVWSAFAVLIFIFLVDWLVLQKLFGRDYSAPFFKVVPLDAATWILLYVIFLFTLGPI